MIIPQDIKIILRITVILSILFSVKLPKQLQLKCSPSNIFDTTTAVKSPTNSVVSWAIISVLKFTISKRPNRNSMEGIRYVKSVTKVSLKRLNLDNAKLNELMSINFVMAEKIKTAPNIILKKL